MLNVSIWRMGAKCVEASILTENFEKSLWLSAGRMRSTLFGYNIIVFVLLKFEKTIDKVDNA